MNDTRRPEDPGTPGPAPEDPRPEKPEAEEGHGLVEGIREEISEVVEHVPAPVRWTIRRVVGLIALGLFGFVVVVIASAILYVANRTEWVAKEVTLLLNQTLALRSDVEVRIGDMRGNPFTGVRMIHPVVRYRDGSEPPLLEADALQLHYSSWALLTGGSGPIDIVLEKPRIRIERGKDGRLRFPKWRSSGRAGGPGGRRLQVHFTVHDGRVESPVLTPSIEGLEARAGVRLGGATRVDLQNLSWTAGPYGNPLQRLHATAEFGDSVRIDVPQLQSRELVLSAHGAWKAGSKPRRVRVHLVRVRWAWLARVFQNGAFDVPGEASADIDAELDQGWAGRFRTALTWNALEADGTGRFTFAGDRLEMTAIDASTPSGRVTGHFAMTGKAWELNGRAEHADPRAWKAFHLDGWPAGDLNGTFRITQSATKDMTLQARLGPSVLAGWRADSAAVVFRAPSATTDTFVVDYWRQGGSVRLLAGTRAWGWAGRYDARDFPLEAWPDGASSGLHGWMSEGRGEVVSRDGGLEVTGTLSGTRTEWLGARFDGWTLSGVRGRLLPAPDLVADARLRDMMFLGLHFDTTLARFHLGDSNAALDSVTAFAGDTTLSLRGRTAWGGAGWSLTLDHAVAASSQFRWVAEPPLVLRGDPQGVDFDRVVAHDGDATLVAGGRWAAPGGQYSFDLHGERLDLGRLGLPQEWGLAGSSAADLKVRGPNGDPVWDFTAHAIKPAWDAHEADSLSLDLEGGRHRLDVHRVVLAEDDGTLVLTGRVEGTEQPWPDTLTADGVTRWIASAAAWQGMARAEAIDLEGLDRILTEPVGWSGRLDGEVTIGGRPADPALSGNVAVAPFAWRDFRMDRVSGEATLTDRRLRVSRFEMSRGGVVSTIQGEMPLRLALGEPVTIPDAPMEWHAQIPKGDLAVLPAFVDQIGWARGGFDLNASVGGTARRPRILGSMDVRDGSLRLAGREEVLEGLTARLHFDENRITLDTLTARQGREGRVAAEGVIDLQRMAVHSYRFDLALRNFTASEEGLYAAQFDGDFVVTNGPKVRGTVVPQVTGKVDLSRAAVLFDFANQSETQQLAATTKPLYWTYRVELAASRNLHWQPPDGDIEFSADLTLEQTPDSLIIYGDLTGERGTYYFLSNRFNVARANLTFDNESGVNPQLDIQATARVVPTQVADTDIGSTSATAHDVTATITGRAAEPVVSFSSNPPDWDEPQILRELTVGRFVSGSGALSGDPFDNYLTRAINRTVSAEMSRAFRGYVNEWALEREQGGLLRGEGNLVMGVGTQLGAGLSLRYKQVLPGLSRGTPSGAETASLFQRQVEAEYRLSRFFYVTSELSQRRPGDLNGPRQDFNVDLKARWEY